MSWTENTIALHGSIQGLHVAFFHVRDQLATTRRPFGADLVVCDAFGKRTDLRSSMMGMVVGTDLYKRSYSECW